MTLPSWIKFLFLFLSCDVFFPFFYVAALQWFIRYNNIPLKVKTVWSRGIRFIEMNYLSRELRSDWVSAAERPREKRAVRSKQMSERPSEWHNTCILCCSAWYKPPRLPPTSFMLRFRRSLFENWNWFHDAWKQHDDIVFSFQLEGKGGWIKRGGRTLILARLKYQISLSCRKITGGKLRQTFRMKDNAMS